MVVAMAVLEYDLVFAGGGLAALLLLGELGPALPDGVAVVDPHLPPALLERVMGAIALAQSLRFIDEDLPPRQLLPLVRTAVPVVLGKKR
jgi:hypothetical protein